MAYGQQNPWGTAAQYILPIVGGVLGSVIAPGAGTAAGAMLGASIGSAVGGAAGQYVNESTKSPEFGNTSRPQVQAQDFRLNLDKTEAGKSGAKDGDYNLRLSDILSDTSEMPDTSTDGGAAGGATASGGLKGFAKENMGSLIQMGLEMYGDSQQSPQIVPTALQRNPTWTPPTVASRFAGGN